MDSMDFFEIKALLDKDDEKTIEILEKKADLSLKSNSTLKLFISINKLEKSGKIQEAIDQIKSFIGIKKPTGFMFLLWQIYIAKFLFQIKKIQEMNEQLQIFKQNFQGYHGSVKEKAYLTTIYLNLMGNLHILKKELSKAHELLFKSLDSIKQHEFHSELAEVYNLIAKMFYYQANLSQAISYLDKALAIYENHKNEKKMGQIYLLFK